MIKTGKNQNRTDKEMLQSRKMMLLESLKADRKRKQEISHCLIRPNAYSKETFNEFCTESSVTANRINITEQKLYAEYGMNDAEIDEELKTI